MPASVAAVCVLVVLVGRGARDAEGVGAAAGRARRLAVASPGAEAARSLTAVLTRAPRRAPQVFPWGRESMQKIVQSSVRTCIALANF